GPSVRGLEVEGAARGHRRADRLEAPAVHRLQRLAVEDARRRGVDHARRGDRAVHADGELDLDGAGAAAALRFARIGRRGRADRAQLVRGGGALRRRRGGRGRLLLRLLHRGGRGDRRRALLRRGGRRGRGRRRGAGLLLRERFGRFLLLALLVGDALALELGLAARLLVGGQLLLLRATRDGGLAVGDRLLQARQRRRLGVG